MKLVVTLARGRRAAPFDIVLVMAWFDEGVGFALLVAVVDDVWNWHLLLPLSVSRW